MRDRRPTLNDDAQAVLSAWAPPDSEQDALRAEYLAHLRTFPDATWRSCRSGHITSSALIVDPVGGRVLLTLHPGVGRWLQTGGHCEPADTSLSAAAGREAREEGGIPSVGVVGVPLRLDRHEVMCRDDSGHSSSLDHLDVQWLAIAPANSTPRMSAESADLRWWPWDGLPTGTTGADASVHALVAAARTRLGM